MGKNVTQKGLIESHSGRRSHLNIRHQRLGLKKLIKHSTPGRRRGTFWVMRWKFGSALAIPAGVGALPRLSVPVMWDHKFFWQEKNFKKLLDDQPVFLP